MKCPVCSAELPSTAKFCGSCGTTITSPPPQDYSSPPSSPSGPPYGNPSGPSYGSFSPPTYGMSQTSGGGTKYKNLRMVANVLKILAFVLGGLLVIVALISMVSGAASSTSAYGGPAALFGGFMFGLVILVYAVVVFCFLYAFGECIYVLLDIEEHTQKSKDLLSKK